MKKFLKSRVLRVKFGSTRPDSRSDWARLDSTHFSNFALGLDSTRREPSRVESICRVLDSFSVSGAVCVSECARIMVHPHWERCANFACVHVFASLTAGARKDGHIRKHIHQHIALAADARKCGHFWKQTQHVSLCWKCSEIVIPHEKLIPCRMNRK